TASASTDVGTNATSSASSQISSISLFGGEVTAATVIARADGSTRGQGATGDLSNANVTGLTVNGAAASAGPNGRVALGDWGYAVTLEQATARGANGRSQNFRGYVTGLDVHVTAAHGNVPAGTEILIGYAEAWVQAGTKAPAVPKAPGSPTGSAPTKAAAKQPKPPEPRPGKPQSLIPP